MTDRGTYSAVQLGRDMRPSNGETLASAPALPNGRCPPEILAHWRPGRVVIAWSYAAAPPRRLKPASLAAVRRKRLWRRLTRKMPLLADQLYAEELAARPAFYAGERAGDPAEPKEASE